jgi:hypothetical protein
MSHDSRDGATSLSPLTTKAALETFFLDARARLLDLAAILDRIERGGSGAAGDSRVDKIRQALTVLHDHGQGRAERIQQIFSLDYDAAWERPTPR